MAVRTWVWVTLAVLAVLMVGCFTVVGTGIFLVTQQFEVTETDEQSAAEQMQQVRARFEGQPPMLAADEEGRLNDAELKRRAAAGAAREPERLRVLIWNDREARLVRLSIPFWLMRLGRGGYEVDLSDGGNLRVGRVRVDPEDLGRAGPGLVLDHQEADGTRILLWTE
jgi:hypothetical protein